MRARRSEKKLNVSIVCKHVIMLAFVSTWCVLLSNSTSCQSTVNATKRGNEVKENVQFLETFKSLIK